MSAETNPLVEKIKVLDLKPGDIIVLMSKHPLSDVAYENIRTSMRENLDLPDNKILILEEGLDIKLIRTETLRAELQAHECPPDCSQCAPFDERG